MKLIPFTFLTLLSSISASLALEREPTTMPALTDHSPGLDTTSAGVQSFTFDGKTYKYFCDTTNRSPDAADVVHGAGLLGKLWNYQCMQIKGNNKCTELTTYGTARIWICGPEGWWQWCDWVGESLLFVAWKCERYSGGWRVGATVYNDSLNGEILRIVRS